MRGILIALGLIATVLICNTVGSVGYTPTPEILPFSNSALLVGINRYRASANEAPLVDNHLLNESAQLHANDMSANHYFDHVSPSGVSPWHWFEAVGYDYSKAGENIAKCYQSNDAVLQAWWNSPEHRANILGDFKDTGFGYAYLSNNCVVIVEHFGRAE